MNWNVPAVLRRFDLSSVRSLVNRPATGMDSQSALLEYEPTPDDTVDFDIPSGFDETERYWVNRPYSFISILYDDEIVAHEYHAVEPELTEFERELLEFVLRDLRDVLIHSDQEWAPEDEGETGAVFKETMADLLEEYGLVIRPDSFYRIYYYVWRAYVGYGKLDPLMRDPHIEDISCDGYGVPVYVYHERYQNLRANLSYEKEELDSFVIRLAQEAGKNISLEKPYVSGAMSDGSRIELSYGSEVTRHGSTFTVRKFAEEPYTPIDLIEFGTFSTDQMAYLWLAIENNKSLIFGGGTASGKTTSMNAVSMFIPPRSKVVSIEDTPEINLYHENWVPGMTRQGPGIQNDIGMFALLRSSLRQRPEYIIVGEVRGEEALTLFQAMNTGHTTYSTIHAESVQTVVRRLENPPIEVPRAMLAELDIISVQRLTYVGENRVRRTDRLVEIAGMDDRTGDLNFVELFEWEPETDSFHRTGNSRVLRAIAEDRGMSRREIQTELRHREQVLRHLQETGVTGYKQFTQTIHEYYADPDRVLKRIDTAPTQQ